MTNKIDRTHGDTGTEPANGSDFQSGERPDPQEFDWWWYTVTTKINSLVDDVVAIKNGDVKVGDATTADNATNVTATYKGNDIDSDGDGKVDQAVVADQTTSFEVRSSDPSSPSDGQVWIRDDL